MINWFVNSDLTVKRTFAKWIKALIDDETLCTDGGFRKIIIISWFNPPLRDLKSVKYEIYTSNAWIDTPKTLISRIN